MELCTETITVFNATLDDDGYDVYNPTVIKGASWYCTVESTVDSNGLKAANKFTIRIPEDADFSDKKYVDPVTYAATADPSTVFTLRNGDIIARGAITDSSLKPAEIHKSYEALTILGITDNRRGKSHHWKVVGA